MAEASALEANLSEPSPESVSHPTPPESMSQNPVSAPVQSVRFSTQGLDHQMKEISSDEEEESREEEKDVDINRGNSYTDIVQSFKELQTFVEASPIPRNVMKGKITPSMLYLPKKAPSRPITPKVEPGKSLEDSLQDHEIRLFAATWNMHGQLPEDISRLIPIKPEPHIYIIASQECMRSIPKSIMNQSKDEWEQKLSTVLGPDYVMLRSHTMVAIHLSIFVHSSLQASISAIGSADIGTGFAKQGNKGAVGIEFKIGNTSVLCICCHLASGQNNVKRRNTDFSRINQELNLSQKQAGISLSDSYDAVIWLGDMNYRINGPKEAVEYLILQNVLDVLKKSDQLSIERTQNRFPQNFLEGEIRFPPTYRFDPGSDTYDTSRKQRIPGWCDRILYRSKKDCLRQKRYGSVMEMRDSDHKPVFGEFELKFTPGDQERSGEIFRQSKRSGICSIF